MKLNYNFVIKEVAGTYIAVPVGDNSSELKGYIRLNETGASVLKLLEKGFSSTEDIVTELLKEYEGSSKEEVAQTVDEFLAQLEQANIIQK